MTQDITTRFRPTNFEETPGGLKTWSDLKGSIKGLADFLTPAEEKEIQELHVKGKLPESVDYSAVQRYINFCYQELLPGINKNRVEAGLPPLVGRVLGNAIMGDRWKRDRAAIPHYYSLTADRVFLTEALPKPGQWGHLRDEYIRGRAAAALASLKEGLLKGHVVPSVKLVTEYFTYRDASNLPYGFAYSVRLEEYTERTVLEHMSDKIIDLLSEFVYRELPEKLTSGVTFADLPEEKQAYYRFMVKKTIEGLGVTASLL